MRAWREMVDPSLALEGFEGRDCHLGLHLAGRIDLAALALALQLHIGSPAALPLSTQG